MTCHRIPNGIMCLGGPIVKHAYDGRVWRWEAHPYFGPWPLKKNGDPWVRAPGERHAFWRAVGDYDLARLTRERDEARAEVARLLGLAADVVAKREHRVSEECCSMCRLALAVGVEVES